MKLYIADAANVWNPSSLALRPLPYRLCNINEIKAICLALVNRSEGEFLANGGLVEKSSR